MSTTDRIRAEATATRALLDLLKQVDECRELYERAGMELPEPLKRFFGLDTENNSGGPAVQVPPLRRSRVPKEADSEWVSIALEDASAQSLVLAVLRRAGRPVHAKEVVQRVQKIRPNVSGGTVANIGTRLSQTGIIERSKEEGWGLNSNEDAGIILGDYLWALPTALFPQELAAHRREAIMHLLWGTQTGYQATQLEEHLRNTRWMRAPVNKDQIKADLKCLVEEKKIKRRGNTRKWELAHREEASPS